MKNLTDRFYRSTKSRELGHGINVDISISPSREARAECQLRFGLIGMEEMEFLWKRVNVMEQLSFSFQECMRKNFIIGKKKRVDY